VEDATILPLKSWESFYVIVGSAAAALTGLMFVVITLLADTRRQRSGGALDAFATPTIVHFCTALLVSAIASAPWPSLGRAAEAIGAVGIASTVYVLIVVRRARRQRDYTPVFEDWLWHFVLPLVAYVLFALAAILMTAHSTALFAVGAGTLLLVFVGIHNAWDTVTYIALDMDTPNDAKPGAPRPAASDAPVAGG
jgi:hypothetical protein